LGNTMVGSEINTCMYLTRPAFLGL
jgi:hypothetical protein